MIKFAVLALAFLSATVADAARADEALIAVAANFAGVMDAINADFTTDTGHTLQVTTGSTGKLYAQIREGALFDVLLSADAQTPARLVEDKLAMPGSRFTYAIGKLSLWSADEGRIGVDPKAALLAPDTRHVAIANPDLAPYGVAAREALTSMGLWETIRPKIVMGENIGQAHSMVDSGAAQMGFIARSAIDGPGSASTGSRFDVPQEMFTPIRQDAVLLKAGEGNEAAIAFLDYLKADKAKAIIASFGYGTE